MVDVSVALVSTVRNPGISIRSFVAYHLACGFDRIFLFFDDPEDAWINALPDDERIQIIACDQELRSCWADWPDMLRFADKEVMARQALNAELAIQLARSAGIDWLLHIDADEAFDASGVRAAHYFDSIDPRVEQVTFLNWEVVPEVEDVEDFFRECTLFKRNRGSLPGGRLTATQSSIVANVPQLPSAWFFYYANGKSAVRVGPGVVPWGVHSFARANALETVTIETPRVLHYMNTGFENFWRKYRTWGRFLDTWFGALPISDAIGTFHLLARDVVMSGDRRRAQEFYRQRVVLNDDALINKLISSGLCERIQGPSNLLRQL